MKMRYLAAILVMSAGPAAADEAEWRQQLRDCVYGQPVQTAISCRGEIEAACLAGRDAEPATVLDCRAAEAAAWQDLMEETFPQAIGTTAEGDGSGPDPVAPFDAALRRSQIAWAGWAEAECALQEARWGEGVEAGIARAGCERRLFADRLVELRILAEGW